MLVPVPDSAFDLYLEFLSKGWRSGAACRDAGFSYSTLCNKRKADPAFVEREREAKDIAIGRLDHKIYDAAMDGQLDIGKDWLKAHDREVWGADRKITVENKHTLELTATQEGIQALEAELVRRLELKGSFQEREAIEAESWEGGEGIVPDEALIGEAHIYRVPPINDEEVIG